MERFFQNKEGRAREFFGFGWQFALTDSPDFPGEQAPWQQVQLPHDWSVQYPVQEDAPSCGSGGYARTGIGWYRRRFSAGFSDQEQVSLYFEGVYMNCDIWVNGTHVGGHVYGYTSFELEVTGVLLAGDNDILIRVDNSQQPGSRWYTGSGITRDVYILRTNRCHVKTWGVCITTPEIGPEQATVRAVTDITGAFDRKALRLETRLLDEKGTVCACAGCALSPKPETTAFQELALPAPALWDTESPALYTAVSLLYDGETLVDEVHSRFGVRDIAYNAEQGFLLNGRKVILKGVCLHHDGGCVGAAVPVPVWSRRLRKLREMGTNALRFSHNPPDPALLDLADEMGFLVMDEAFDEWHAMKGKEFGSNTHESRGYSEWFESCFQRDMTDMILRDRNHPSIIMWSIGNEVREQVLEGGWEIARKLAGICHSLDATRPVTQGCDQVKAEPVPAYEAFLNELDIVGVNYTDRWRERTETFFDEEKREHPDWLLLGTEDISVSGRRGNHRLQTEKSVWGRTPYYANMLKAEKLWKFIRTRPYVIGSFMWTGIDYLGECFWPDKSASAGVLDLCGFEKDGFYFYQSIWTEDRPMLHVCPTLNEDYAPGSIVPLIVYSNCHCVELLVDGKSYGVKAYEFPGQGMTKEWAHFDRTPAPITTNDLHLSWDIPWPCKEVVAVGRDPEGHEVLRKRITAAGAPAGLFVQADRESLLADGRDVVQLTVALRDREGRTVPDADLPVSITVTGGTLLGMDNGQPDCRELYDSGVRRSYRGLLYAVIRAARQEGEMFIEVSASGLERVKLCIPVG